MNPCTLDHRNEFELALLVTVGQPGYLGLLMKLENGFRICQVLRLDILQLRMPVCGLVNGAFS